jgi:type II pantothenate kinase
MPGSVDEAAPNASTMVAKDTSEDGEGPLSSSGQRPRTATNTAEIGSAVIHPGSVRINVTGAFIVDSSPPGTPTNGAHHDTKDIRLPNHTAVVSHIAIDVSTVAFSTLAYLAFASPSLVDGLLYRSAAR